jgi:hypothetical protein
VSWKGKVLSAREAIFEAPPRVEIDLADDASLPSTRLSPGNWSLSPHNISKVILDIILFSIMFSMLSIDE